MYNNNTWGMRKELPTLKKAALKTVLTNIHKYTAQDIDNLPDELIEDLIAHAPLKKTFPVNGSLIGTIKINCLPVDKPRIYQHHTSQENNLLLCVRQDNFDQRYRNLAVYSVKKNRNYTIDELTKFRPLKTFCAALEPEITCYTVHPSLPLVVFGTIDGTIVLIDMEKNIPKEFCQFYSEISAIGFDVENQCVVSCVTTCKNNNFVYILPINYARPTIKIENAPVLCNIDFIEDTPVYFNKRDKLPIALLHPEKPVFNQILLEFYILTKLLKQQKTKDPSLIQRIDQAKQYFEKLEIDLTSQKALLAHLNDIIDQEKQKENEETHPSWSWITTPFKKHFNK